MGSEMCIRDRSDTRSVTVTVTDVNESPVITSGATVDTVAENSTGVGTYTATDPDGDALTWSVSDTSTFTIGKTSGVLTFQTAPDYESDPIGYTVTVKASDGSLSDTLTVTVTVNDVDESPGKPTGVTVAPAASEGHTKLTVRWTKPSNTGPALSSHTVRSCKTNEVPACDMGYVPWKSKTVGGSATSTTLSGLSSSTSYTVQVRAKNAEGTGPWSAKAKGSTFDDLPAAKALVDSAALTLVAAPNPFNPRTAIQIDLPVSGQVTLEVYSLSGQVVRRLLHQPLPAGSHTLFWEGRDDRGRPVAAGMYFCRLTAGGQVIVHKVTLIR